MDRSKIIGMIFAVLLGIAGSFGLVSTDAVKGQICGTAQVESK